MRPHQALARRSSSLRCLPQLLSQGVAPGPLLLLPLQADYRPDSPAPIAPPALSRSCQAAANGCSRARGAAAAAVQACAHQAIVVEGVEQAACSQGRCRGAAAGCADAAAARSAAATRCRRAQAAAHPIQPTGAQGRLAADQVQIRATEHHHPQRPIRSWWRSRVLPLRRACRPPLRRSSSFQLIVATAGPDQGGRVTVADQILIAAGAMGSAGCPAARRLQQVLISPHHWRQSTSSLGGRQVQPQLERSLRKWCSSRRCSRMGLGRHAVKVPLSVEATAFH